MSAQPRRLPVFAVSQRVDVVSDRGEKRDSLDQRLTNLLSIAGIWPILVPNTLVSRNELGDWLDAISPSGIVLSGGNNIGEFPERDETERFLLDRASEKSLPVLGICRGMQMMAVWAGGSLKQVTGHVRSRHKLTGEITDEVNSYHDYSPAECPPSFEVMARSEDGEIEAIRHSSLPWQGWMWHPEREAETSASDIARIRALLVE